jgi:hypothetical protein
VELGGGGPTVHDEIARLSERKRGCWCWERIEEGDGQAAGERATFIDVESGGWPVHAPCPMRRPLNSGG